MPIIRKFAVQGHDLPRAVYSPGQIFDPKVTNQKSVVYDVDHGDSLHPGLDDIRMFRCRDCGTILYEDDLHSHDCADFL